MKINTNLIPNFDALPEEAKEAILGMEFADAPDMSQFVAKAVFDKKASEAADLSKQLKSRMTQDEQAAVQQAETLASLQAELENRIAAQAPNIEAIQDTVERQLMNHGFNVAAKAYILYRKQRLQCRWQP